MLRRRRLCSVKRRTRRKVPALSVANVSCTVCRQPRQTQRLHVWLIDSPARRKGYLRNYRLCQTQSEPQGERKVDPATVQTCRSGKNSHQCMTQPGVSSALPDAKADPEIAGPARRRGQWQCEEVHCEHADGCHDSMRTVSFVEECTVSLSHCCQLTLASDDLVLVALFPPSSSGEAVRRRRRRRRRRRSWESVRSCIRSSIGISTGKIVRRGVRVIVKVSLRVSVRIIMSRCIMDRKTSLFSQVHPMSEGVGC